MPKDEFDLRIISLGAGVQSTTMYRMAALGQIPGPTPDYAIFADTQAEPAWVHESLDSMERDHGDKIPILRVTGGNLSEDLAKGLNSTGGRFAAVPFWMEGADGSYAPGRRQCTREYKIDVIKQEIRRLLGLKKGERAAGRFLVEQWIGISVDEATRAKMSRDSWMVSRWPLLYDVPMRRNDCKDWLTANGFAIPEKSACVFCPYRGEREYGELRDNHPEEFSEACRIDDLIRSSENGKMRGMRKEQYVLKSMIPLRDLPPTAELKHGSQIDLWDEECEGMCGV